MTRTGTDTWNRFSFGLRVSQRKGIQITQDLDMGADKELSRRKGKGGQSKGEQESKER